jgi:hypothetical protein
MRADEAAAGDEQHELFFSSAISNVKGSKRSSLKRRETASTIQPFIDSILFE